jgi:hypothetical protein
MRNGTFQILCIFFSIQISRHFFSRNQLFEEKEKLEKSRTRLQIKYEGLLEEMNAVWKTNE